jgi:hypothetical protein
MSMLEEFRQHKALLKKCWFLITLDLNSRLYIERDSRMFEVLKAKIKNYISDEDVLLCEFDRDHPERSVSIQKEIAKHQRIRQLRDVEQSARPSVDEDKALWDGF